MKLSKILKALCGRIITPNSYDKPEAAPTAPATCHTTPIYESHRTTPYRAYNPSWKFRLPATNHNCDFLLPMISRPIPSPPPLPSPQPIFHDERQTPEPVGPCESVLGAAGLSGTLSSPPLLPYPVVEEETTPVYELAAYRTPTETLSSQTRNEANSPHEHIRDDEPDGRTDRQSFEDELRRLSDENERQQVHIYDLVARVNVAERKAQELAGGSRLTRQRKLRIRISKLIEELQVKETEVQEWVARYGSAVQKAHISRDGEGRELVMAIQAIKEDMEASNGVLQNLCGFLENRALDVEQKEMVLDRKAKGMRMYWSEENLSPVLWRQPRVPL